MGSFQQWLDRTNARYGGIGAVITATICLAVLVYALLVILGDFW
ncbi:MAG TPA: hypothetical protein VKB51_01355 [bacterium]|nr:hypothetical protein [bacterium]